VHRVTRGIAIRGVDRGEWVSLVREDGERLEGIRGRAGAVGQTLGGAEFGADTIEMQSGSAFPLHAHEGDHVLYIIRGRGFVHAGGVDHPVQAGDTIFVPAELPHGVRADGEGRRPLLFLAVGLPHKPVGAADRMRLVEEPAGGG
jgi:quercetin dioxygenase-like cupin family protein